MEKPVEPRASAKSMPTLDDLIKEASNKKTDEVKIEAVEVSNIQIENAWVLILNKIDKTHLDFDYLSTLKPVINETRFEFTVQNEIQQSIVENNFPMFRKIYAELANAHADWICHIDETIISTTVLLNKNDKLQKLIEKYPLLEEFKKEFGLDMYD